MQSSWWAEFRSAAGYGNFGAIIRRQNVILGGGVVHALPWDDRHGFYYLPDGPVLPAGEPEGEEVFNALLELIRARARGDELQITHLRLEPRWTAIPPFLHALAPVEAPDDIWQEPRHTICIDLRSAETAILAQMRPKGRYNIVVARRHGVRVVTDTSSRGVDDFLALYHSTFARKALTTKPDDYF